MAFVTCNVILQARFASELSLRYGGQASKPFLNSFISHCADIFHTRTLHTSYLHKRLFPSRTRPYAHVGAGQLALVPSLQWVVIQRQTRATKHGVVSPWAKLGKLELFEVFDR
jgi:hypothetical protein